MTPKQILSLFQKTFQAWSADKAPRLAAALAYYTIFSLAPLLILTIALVGRIYGEQAVSGQIVAQIGQFVGEDTALFIQNLIVSADRPGSGLLATVIGGLTLLLGASGVFGQLQDSLDTIWHVPLQPGRSLFYLLRARLLSFGMVLGIGLLLLLTFFISAALSLARNLLSQWLPPSFNFLPLLDFLSSLLIIGFAFAMIFRAVPRVVIPWLDAFVGGLFTAFLFAIGKAAISFYLGQGGIGSAYGAAGSLIVLLVWVYYSAQIFLLGAEFTKVYSGRSYLPAPAPSNPIAQQPAPVLQPMPLPSSPSANYIPLLLLTLAFLLGLLLGGQPKKAKNNQPNN